MGLAKIARHGLMNRASRVLTAILIFFLFAVTLAQSAYAQLEIEVSVGFNGKFLSDHFTPVAVNLKYRGTPLQGEIELSQHSKPFLEDPVFIAQRKPINLGANADRVLYFYFPVSSFSPPDEDFPKLVLTIWVDGNSVASKELTLSDDIERDPVVLFVSEVESRRTLPTDERAEYILVGQLPQDWRGLDSVQRIYFGRARINQLTPRQESAIEKWVMAGGELVVLSGENFFLQDSPWLRGMVPFDVEEVQPRTADLPSMAVGRPTGELLFAAGTSPILVERELLLGSIIFSTIDLVARGDVEDETWSILAPASRDDRNVNHVGERLLNDVSLRYPDKFIVGTGIVLYLCVFGYFSLWVLRQPTSRLRKSMLDIPENKKQGGKVLAVLLGAIFFFTVPAVGYLSQSHFINHYSSIEIGTIMGTSDLDIAWNRNWYSVAAKRTTSVELVLGSDSIIAPINNSEIEVSFEPQGAKIQVLPEQMEGWSKSHLYTEQLIPAQLRLRKTNSSANVRGSQIEVYNDSHWHLDDVALYRDGNFYPIGELEPGESLEISESELESTDWPVLPQYEYQYNTKERSKATLIELPEVTERLGRNREQWILVGWIANDHIARNRLESRSSLKLVMIEEES